MKLEKGFFRCWSLGGFSQRLLHVGAELVGSLIFNQITLLHSSLEGVEESGILYGKEKTTVGQIS